MTASRLVGALATLVALAFALVPAYPYTFAVTVLIGVLSVVVAHSIYRQQATHEFVTSFTVPLFGLLIVVAPAMAVYETHGVVLEPFPVLETAAIGFVAAIAAAVVFPLAAGGFRPDLPQLTLGLSGQLFVPLGLAVAIVYLLEVERILDAAPHPEYLYVLLVIEPVESGTIAPLLVTSGLLWMLLGFIGILFSRPLEYEWLYPEEWEGHVLDRLARFFYGLAFAVVIVGWITGFLLLLVQRPEVSYPAGIWLFIDTLRSVAENQTLVRLLVNMLLVYAVGAIVISPLYVLRWVERTNTLWLIRHVFSGSLALVVGLTAAYFLRNAILASESTLETMDSIGDPAWTVFELLPVVLTGLPFLGTVAIFSASLFYVVVFERGTESYPLYVDYRNVGVGALFFVTVLAVAGGTPTIYALLAAGAAVVAWDTFEYSYTLHVELPLIDRVNANELVHAAGISGVVLASVVLAVTVDWLVSPLVVDRDGILFAAFLVILGAVVFIFALRE